MPQPLRASINRPESALPCSDAGGWGSPAYYSTIHCADIDGDGHPELLARGAAGIVTWKFDIQRRDWLAAVNGPALSDAAGWNQPVYYETLQFADIDGDKQAELLARGVTGINIWKYDPRSRNWIALPPGPALSDAAGWSQPHYYKTIQCADIDGDGRAELLARGAGGIGTWKWDPVQRAWMSLPGPDLNDAAGWNQPPCYETIQCADIDGDRQLELLARGPGGISAWKWNPKNKNWDTLPGGPAWSDAAGWNQPAYYRTIQCADIDGDGRAELIARSVTGIQLWKFDPAARQWKQLPDGPPLSDAAGWNLLQFGETITAADIDGDGRAEFVARGATGIVAWKSDVTGKWTQINKDPGLPASAAWSDPKYYETIQFADLDANGSKDLLLRGPDGVVARSLDLQRGSVWTRLPRKGPIPKPTPTNIDRVQANLSSLKELANQIHDSSQDSIQELFLLAQVESKDWASSLLIFVISAGFKSLGATPMGGAGTVLSAVFNYGVSRDQRGDIKSQFADVWQRFAKAFLLLKTEISQFQSNLAGKSTLEKTWLTLLPVDPDHPDALVLGDLANEDIPAENGARASDFNQLILDGVAAFKYSLWQATLRQRWNIGAAVYPFQKFKSERACIDFLRTSIQQNPWSYGTYAQLKTGEWEVTWQSLFSKVGLPLQTFASKQLCQALFQDDGYGTIMNSDGIATRADVFTNWGLSVISYKMSTGPVV